MVENGSTTNINIPKDVLQPSQPVMHSALTKMMENGWVALSLGGVVWAIALVVWTLEALLARDVPGWELVVRVAGVVVLTTNAGYAVARFGLDEPRMILDRWRKDAAKDRVLESMHLELSRYRTRASKDAEMIRVLALRVKTMEANTPQRTVAAMEPALVLNAQVLLHRALAGDPVTRDEVTGKKEGSLKQMSEREWRDAMDALMAVGGARKNGRDRIIVCEDDEDVERLLTLVRNSLTEKEEAQRRTDTFVVP